MRISKYITIVLVLTLAAAGWLGWSIKSYTSENAVLAATEGEMKKEWIRYQMATFWGTRNYGFGCIINADKDYYGVRNTPEESYKIVDKKGNLLKDLEEYGIDMIYSEDIVNGETGRYLAAIDRVTEDYRFYFIDRETLDVYETGCSWLSFHESGEYYLASQMVGYNINTLTAKHCTGTVLYESEYPMALTSDRGYVIEQLYYNDDWLAERTGMTLEELGDADLFDELEPEYMEGNSRLVELETGKIIYTAKAGETIKNYAGGLLEMMGKADVIDAETGGQKKTECWYLLDENFKPALNGQLFSSVDVMDGYIIGLGYRDAYLHGQENYFRKDDRMNWCAMIFDRDGTLLYEGKPDSRISALEDVRGDFAAVRMLRGTVSGDRIEYVKLSELTGLPLSGGEQP